MHLILKFKDNGFLYYYFLFLFVLGSCTYSGSGGEASEEGDVEDIEEDFDENENIDQYFEKKPEHDEHVEIPDELYDELSDELSDHYFPDISGRWVKLMIFKGKAKPPSISPPVAWAVMVLKVDVEQQDAEITSFNEMCRLKVGIDSPVLTPIIPDSFAKALPVVEKPAHLSIGEEGEVLFYQPKVWEVRSCYLEDPENDPLPESQYHPNVFDPDDTGINGLLMRSSGVVSGNAEIVQKVSTELNGYIDEEGNIRGIVKWFEDQKVLWTDNILMRNGAPTYPDPDGDPNDSIFIYKRVDPSWDCDVIRERSAELFPDQAEIYPDEFR